MITKCQQCNRYYDQDEVEECTGCHMVVCFDCVTEDHGEHMDNNFEDNLFEAQVVGDDDAYADLLYGQGKG